MDEMMTNYRVQIDMSGGQGRVFAIAANTDGKASLKSIYRACRPNMALNARTAMR